MVATSSFPQVRPSTMKSGTSTPATNLYRSTAKSHPGIPNQLGSHSGPPKPKFGFLPDCGIFTVCGPILLTICAACCVVPCLLTGLGVAAMGLFSSNKNNDPS